MADTVLKEETETRKYNLYDPAMLERRDAAAAALDDHVAARPAEYTSKYQPQIDAAMDKVLTRQPFKYDVAADALYQQYKDQYSSMGRQAMQDTMGQAAALTGGYGSTYGQRVGQQTYDQYMQGLTDKIPQLYQLALDQYDRDYAYDKDRLSILDAAENKDYGRWGDDLSIWDADRNYLAGRYDTELGQAMTAGEQMYSRLQALMELGYVPTDDELRMAGMTRDQANLIAGITPGGGGGGGGDDWGSGDGNRVKDEIPATYKTVSDAARAGATTSQLYAAAKEAAAEGNLIGSASDNKWLYATGGSVSKR